jgi:hypothetical protein
MVLHNAFKQAHPGAHKAVFQLENCMFIHTEMQEHIAPFSGSGPSDRAMKGITGSAGVTREVDPVIGHVARKRQIALVHILPRRLNLI